MYAGKKTNLFCGINKTIWHLRYVVGKQKPILNERIELNQMKQEIRQKISKKTQLVLTKAHQESHAFSPPAHLIYITPTYIYIIICISCNVLCRHC